MKKYFLMFLILVAGAYSVFAQGYYSDIAFNLFLSGGSGSVFGSTSSTDLGALSDEEYEQ